MTANEILRELVETIHTTVVATVDEDGLPVTAAIDMMDADEEGLWFLTARGKSLYDRLTRQKYLALTGIRGEDTMHSVAVSVRGRVREIGAAPLGRLFRKNPYMTEIYPTEQSREALTVFCLYEGSGEWFDLSKQPIERIAFTFGGAKEKPEGFFVTDDCIGCGSCADVCPQRCIRLDAGRAAIDESHCLHCGGCANACPVGAVVRR